MNFILIEGKISPKVTRARSLINSQKANQLLFHLWMYQQTVRNKKIVGATKAEESNVMRVTSKNEPGLFFIVGFFIVRNECLLETTLWHLLLGLFLFCGSTSFSFRFVLC